MNKLEKIKKRYAEAQARKKSIEGSIAELKEQAAVLHAEAEAAANEGDVETYSKKRNAAQECEDKIYVKKAMLSHGDAPITLSEAQVAWSDYIGPANRELLKEYEVYKQLKAKVAEQLKKLAEIHEAALINREECLSMISDLEPEENKWSHEVYAQSLLRMEYLPIDDVVLDGRHLLRTKVITQEESGYILGVLADHRIKVNA